MKQFLVLAICAITVLSACNGGTKKKVLVMGKGTLTSRENTVTYKEGAGYAETTVELSDEKETPITVDVDGTKKTINIPAGEGYYILNLRVDTVVGSKQNLGTDLNNNSMITQEQLKVKIDSLTALTNGVIPAGTKDVYVVAPNAVTLFSPNVNARVFGPFTKIPASLDANADGKPLELYKFRTNSEMRELIGNFTKMTQ